MRYLKYRGDEINLSYGSEFYMYYILHSTCSKLQTKCKNHL